MVVNVAGILGLRSGFFLIVQTCLSSLILVCPVLGQFTETPFASTDERGVTVKTFALPLG